MILANIHKNIIVSDLNAYFKKMNGGGAIVVSGFYEKDLPDVENEATRLGLKQISKKVKNNWCSAMFTV
jgi:ribosomal protein L11 methyltransferase